MEKLQQLIRVVNDGLTQEEFVQNFKIVVDLIKKLQEQNRVYVQDLNSKYENIVKLGVENTSQKTMELCNSELARISRIVEARLSSITNGKPGKDADVQEVANLASIMALEAVKPMIPSIDEVELDLPKLGRPIRDGLELLPEGQKLSIEAIEGLRDELDKRKDTKLGFTQGGFNYGSLNIHFIDDETPSGVVNGVNQNFVVSLIPSPASSLKVYVGGQRLRLTEDYTFSGQTITFLLAPQTGSIILCDYRV